MLIGMSSLLAQVPQAVSFQGLAMDVTGDVMSNDNIDILVSIHANSPTGTVVYGESHNVTTSALGHFTVEIGRGTPSGNSFSNISWGSTNHFAEIEIDRPAPPTIIVGIVQLVSIPKSIVALESGSGIAGPQGPQGAAGAAGTTGAQGAQGPKGPNGTGGICWDTNNNGVGDANEDTNGDGVYDEQDCQGPQGPTGPTGPQGPAGDAGPAGSSVGATGPRGPRGVPGDDYSGPAGNPGPKGPEGSQGPAGPTGATGETGFQGPEGLPGPKGPRGPGGGQPGPKGDTGPKGPTEGSPGPAGNAGPSCFDTNGNGINDPWEDTNGDGAYTGADCNGPAGPTGPTGATGPQGPQGQQGAQGSSDIMNMPMLSTPPGSPSGIFSNHYYLDSGVNRANGQPGFRYWNVNTNSWVD